MSVFRPGVNVTAILWFWCRFPDENLNMFQYHSIPLRFHFLIDKIYSACVNAKRWLKWWISENLQLVASTEKRDFWSCVVYWSETASCFLAVNSVGSWFNTFSVAGIKTRGYNTMVIYYHGHVIRWSYKTIWIHFNLIFK